MENLASNAAALKYRRGIKGLKGFNQNRKPRYWEMEDGRSCITVTVYLLLLFSVRFVGLWVCGRNCNHSGNKGSRELHFWPDTWHSGCFVCCSLLSCAPLLSRIVISVVGFHYCHYYSSHLSLLVVIPVTFIFFFVYCLHFLLFCFLIVNKKSFLLVNYMVLPPTLHFTQDTLFVLPPSSPSAITGNITVTQTLYCIKQWNFYILERCALVSLWCSTDLPF